MAESAVSTSRIEEIGDLGNDDAGTWAYWNSQEKIALKGEKLWRKRGQAIVKRYRDERGNETGTGSTALHRFNILWSNVQTLIPVLYGQTPKPDVDRRFKDQDDAGRFASMILERCLSYSMEEYDFDGALMSAVEDKCLPGRGTVRVLYVPHFGDPIPDTNPEWEAAGAEGAVVDTPGDEGKQGEAEAAPEPAREVVYEECCLQYVYWEDYLEGPARGWREVPWVRFRAYLTRDELVTRFGKAKGSRVNLDFTTKGTDSEDEKNVPDDLLKKAVVHEVWDKARRCVYWYAPGTPDLILDHADDPLELPGFFPCPDPLLATTTTSTRIPVADYIEYQDQARELDTLTARIDRLTRALKVAGVYAGAEKQVLQQLVEDAGENRLVPVEDWASFSTDKGGVAKLIEWLPIQQVAETLIHLYDAREKVKQIIYEITGLADIIRGATAPDETAAAQKLKASFSTRRTGPQQRQVAKFARNLIRLMASVIMQQFEPKTISAITGFPELKPVPQLPPAPPPQILGRDPNTGMGTMVPNPAFAQYQQAAQQVQAIQADNQQKQAQFDAAIALLRKDARHGFRIDIEADSTILPDQQQEKADRTEFVAKFVPLMEQIVPMAQGNPPMAALAREVALFAVRAFRVARPLEETIEKAFDAIAKMPPQPPKGKAGTDPARVQADIQDTQVKAQTERMEIAQKAQESQQDLAFRTQELEQEGRLRGASLALEAKKLDDAKEFRNVRTEATEARMAKGLV
jgi:hypothetical protein